MRLLSSREQGPASPLLVKAMLITRGVGGKQEVDGFDPPPESEALTAAIGCCLLLQMFDASVPWEDNQGSFSHFRSRDDEPAFSQRLFWLQAACFQDIEAIMSCCWFFPFLALFCLSCWRVYPPGLAPIKLIFMHRKAAKVQLRLWANRKCGKLFRTQDRFYRNRIFGGKFCCSLTLTTVSQVVE